LKQSTSKHVLITGGAGFIGANLVRLLLDRNYKITVLDNLCAGRREYLDGLSIDLVHADVLDSSMVERAVAGQDGVIHLAAQTGVPGSLRDPRKDCEVNILGTLNILEACRAEKARTERHGNGNSGLSLASPRVVFASSNAPLGRQVPPATEDKAPLPISPYGASKLAGEAYCLAYHGSWGLRTVVLRFGNVYGPFSGHKGSVLATFFKDILTQGKLVVDGDGGQTRDFIYVGDLCLAILVALESNVCGEVFQVATGTETSINELARLVTQTCGTKIAPRHGPPRQADIRQNYSAVEKIHHALGWEPTTNLKRGLELTMEWFRNWDGVQAR
jgi:UDP-glucose 4-epimerase